MIGIGKWMCAWDDTKILLLLLDFCFFPAVLMLRPKGSFAKKGHRLIYFVKKEKSLRAGLTRKKNMNIEMRNCVSPFHYSKSIYHHPNKF